MLIVLEPVYVNLWVEGGGGRYYANCPRSRVSILITGGIYFDAVNNSILCTKLRNLLNFSDSAVMLFWVAYFTLCFGD